MDPNSREFYKKLAEGPFVQKGFTKQLQKQIEQKMDQESKLSKIRLPKLISVGFALMMFLFLALLLNWAKPETTIQADVQSASSTPVSMNVSNMQLAPIHSVLLLGLRTDLPNNNYSTYRTLIIANDDVDHLQLSLAANGTGLLVPYGQNFWKINVGQSANEINNYLTAYPAKSEPKEVTVRTNDQLKHYEKLVFAGNKYVSMIVQNETRQRNETTASETVWTGEIEQMNSTNGISYQTPGISLQKIFGDDQANQVSGENWIVARQNGKWVPQIAEINISSAKGYILHTLPLNLPESVVSNDQLVCSWEAIKQVRPDALDAVSSPDGDMIAILSTDELYVYPYSNHQFGPLALQLGLNRNESLVMAQWASAKYAANWIEEGKRFLKN